MTKTIAEAAEELATRLDIPIPDGESLEAHRLAIARLVRRDSLIEQLLRLAANGTLRTRYPDGGYLPDGSPLSESSQVDIAEAQAALESNGNKFVLLNQPSQPQTVANYEVVCDMAELRDNGEAIQWSYWLDRKSITPHQAAKLASCIDPIKWPGKDYAQGAIAPSLAEKISRLEEWLGERNTAWTLYALVEALEINSAPFAMKIAVQQANHSSGAQETKEPQANISTPTRPLPAQRFQEQEVLRVIAELGYDAKALPKDIPGKKGVTAEVRAQLPNFTVTVFDKAWERLSKAGDIHKLR